MAVQVDGRFGRLFQERSREAFMACEAPDGRDAAISAPEPVFAANPDLKVETMRILGDESLVAVHDHAAMEAGEPGYATVDMFRVAGCRIVGMGM